MADPEALCELFSDEALAGAQTALEDFGQQRFDDGLPASAMIAAQRRFGRHGTHGMNYQAGSVL